MWLGYNNAGRISMQIIHLFKQFLSSWTLFICSTIHLLLRPSTSPRTIVVSPSEPLRLMYERILCLYPVMFVFWSTEKRRYLLSVVDKGKETRGQPKLAKWNQSLGTDGVGIHALPVQARFQRVPVVDTTGHRTISQRQRQCWAVPEPWAQKRDRLQHGRLTTNPISRTFQLLCQFCRISCQVQFVSPVTEWVPAS
jgi:hypothetical protein